MLLTWRPGTATAHAPMHFATQPSHKQHQLSQTSLLWRPLRKYGSLPTDECQGLCASCLLQVLNDLLDPGRMNLKLREDARAGIIAVDGLHEEVVRTAEEALEGIAMGDHNRKVWTLWLHLWLLC